MEYDELKNKLDVERLQYLNSLISELYNVGVKGGMIYTEQEQTGITNY